MSHKFVLHISILWQLKGKIKPIFFIHFNLIFIVIVIVIIIIIIIIIILEGGGGPQGVFKLCQNTL